MYILDTSALRSIGTTPLRERASQTPLAISPVTFYEILCHLDESNFRLHKANLTRCAIPEILADPFVAHATRVGVAHLASQTRFEEPRVIREALRLLTTTNTLGEFYAASIPEADGRQRPMEDIAANARTELDRHQQDFATVMQSTIAEVRTGLLNPGGGTVSDATVSDASLAQYIGKVCNGLFRDYRNDVPSLDQSVRARFFSSTYAYYGYLVCRALSYATSNRNIDLNDCEDCYISLHLDILRPDTLVTNDSGTREVLNRAFAVFPQIAASGVSIQSRIITAQQFLQEAPPQQFA